MSLCILAKAQSPERCSRARGRKPEGIGNGAHRFDAEGDVLVEGNPKLFGAQERTHRAAN